MLQLPFFCDILDFNNYFEVFVAFLGKEKHLYTGMQFNKDGKQKGSFVTYGEIRWRTAAFLECNFMKILSRKPETCY